MKTVLLIAIVAVAMIGVMVPSVFALEANPKNVDVSSSSVEVNITGTIDDFKSYERLILTVTFPDTSETEYDVRVTGTGIFSKIFTVSTEWDYGTYYVTAKYGEQDLGSTSFMIEPPYDPRIGTNSVNVVPKPEPVVEQVLNCGPGTEELDGVCQVIKAEEPEKLEIASFVDQSKYPQHYIDRYFDEIEYRKWFDSNYPQYNSIYKAVGLEEPDLSYFSAIKESAIPKSKQLKKSGIDIFTSKANYAKGEIIDFNIQIDPERFEKSKEVYLNIWDFVHTKKSFFVNPNEVFIYKHVIDESFSGEVKAFAKVEGGSNDEYFFFVNTPFPTINDFRSDRSMGGGFYNQDSNPEGIITKSATSDLKLLLEFESIKNSIPDLIEHALKYYYEENDRDALFFFNKILELDPYNIEIHLKKGNSLIFLERYEESKIIYENILKIKPSNFEAIFGLADSNYFLGNLNEAKKLYENGLKLNPNDEYGLSFLGLTLTEMNDEKGLDFITESLKSNSDNLDLIFNKAIAEINLKKYPEAIDTMELYLKIEPNDKDAIEFKNEILQESGILKQQRSEFFPKTVDSKCDLVHLLLWTNDNNSNPVFLLPPSSEVSSKIENINKKYLQQMEDEPWKSRELAEKAVQDTKNLLLNDIMKKYNISSSLKPIVREILVNPTGGNGNYVLGLLQMLPEDYVADLQCGKILKSQYFDELYTYLEIGYGKDTADKMFIAIDEAIIEAETKKTNSILSTNTKSNGGGCLIATATYGSELDPQVQQLRELRDNQLLQTESGAAFMVAFNDIYYSFSPSIADYERENPYFKEAVKLAITPMISSLSLMENANSESEVLSIGISVIMLNLGMYLGVPAVVIVGIKKKF